MVYLIQILEKAIEKGLNEHIIKNVIHYKDLN